MRKLADVLAIALFVAAMALWMTGPAYAQSAASGTILGSVVDPDGKTVGDANVVARNVDTGVEYPTTTTADGLYRIPSLPPGIYDVRVQMQGFSTALAKSIKLNVGDQKDLNFKLALATVASEITVTAATPLVETTKTDVSQVVDDHLMESLPVSSGGGGPTNDYANLALSVPGVRMDLSGATGNAPGNGEFIGPGSFNYRSNLYNVDGGNIYDQVVSGRDALGASLNEVKEFQVITNNYNAEYGQAGGIIVNVITKSGTNDIHGTAWAYFRGRNLSASTFFYNTSPDSKARRAPFQKQEWGFNGGGPIIKNRTFWFANFEKTHQATPETLVPGGTAPVTLTQPINEVLFTVKVDHDFSKSQHFTVRFNAQRQVQDNLLVQVPVTAAPESLTFFAFHDHMLNLGLTSNFSAHIVNEGRFFWHRYLNLLPPKSQVPGQAGASFYTGAAFCCPQGGLQNRYQYVDNLTYLRGAHTMKVGANISHFPYFSLFQQFHFGEYAAFQPGTTLANRGTPGHFPTQFIIGAGPGTVTSADDIYGLYVQDSWKLKPNLTMNYGLRYDLERGAFKGGTIGNPTQKGGCFQANGLIPACSSDPNNFQPRLGFAYSPQFDQGFLHTVFGDPGQTVIRASAAEVTQLAFLNVVLDSLNFDGKNLATGTIRNAAFIQMWYPTLPPLTAINAALPPAGTSFGRIRPISPHLRNPETHEFNLTISRQFAKDYLLDLEYVGAIGIGEFGERDLNFPPVIADPAHPGFFYFGARPNPAFTAIRTNENSRTSAYHGFIAHITKQVSHHVQFQGGYTLSKVLSSTEDFFGTSEPGDPRNMRVDRGPAASDIRHAGTFSAVFDTQGVMRGSILGYIVGGWNMGWIGTLQSGRPYPVSTGDAGFAGSVFPGIGAETQQRPNILPGGTISSTNIASNAGSNLLVGPNGAAACACPQTTFLAPAGASGNGASDSFTGDLVDFQLVNGTLQRNAGLGDPLYRFDMSLYKSFHFIPGHENYELQLRADFFNIFNHTNFLLANGNDTLNLFPIGTLANGHADPACVSCMRAIGPFAGSYIGSGGQVLHLQDLRRGRVSRDLGNPVFNGLGDPTATDIPRQIQLSIHIRW